MGQKNYEMIENPIQRNAPTSRNTGRDYGTEFRPHNVAALPDPSGQPPLTFSGVGEIVHIGCNMGCHIGCNTEIILVNGGW